jgi:hypothetical protein
MILYSQILPRESGSFSWTFDSKEINKLTDWENWWKTMIAPKFQSTALREPMIKLEEGDYTYFDRSFEMDTPEWFKKSGSFEFRMGDVAPSERLGASAWS